MNKKTVIILFIGMSFMLPSLKSHAASGFKVIVNATNPTTSLKKEEVTQMFLKKTRNWGDGAKVLPVDLSASAIPRKSFSRFIHGRSVSSIKGYWNHHIFSGRGTPSREKNSDKEVMNYVAQFEGAIGYVSEDAVLGTGVKSIAVE